MSFLRPGAKAFLTRRRPEILALGGGGLGLWNLWQGLPVPDPGRILLGLVLIGVTGALYLGWHQRRRFAGPADAPGIVQIAEAQIAYYGPETGGFVDLDELASVALVVAARGRAHWRLEQVSGPAVEIPLAARGAEDLPDVLSALPGLSMAPALSALRAGKAGMYPIWSRDRPAVPST